MSDDTDRSTPEAAREISIERAVAATPEEVWGMLTTSEGLKRWFALDAKVEPGLGGSVWLSWGPGAEGEAPIDRWEPNKHFAWAEDHGRAEPVRVDIHIEGRDGATLVRIVQSGLSAEAEWDEMYDALTDGWTYFMHNLVFYFQHHGGRDRAMVWARVPTELGRPEVWDRLREGHLVSDAPSKAVLDLGESMEVSVVSARAGYHFAAEIPSLDQSLLFVEIEGKHVGVWLSTYDVAEERRGELQSVLDKRIEALLA